MLSSGWETGGKGLGDNWRVGRQGTLGISQTSDKTEDSVSIIQASPPVCLHLVTPSLPSGPRLLISIWVSKPEGPAVSEANKY